jgi:hypothetical protein
MWKLFSIFYLLIILTPDCIGATDKFVVGAYRAQALIGESKLVEGTDYISFTGDFGFSGWLPTAEAIERHLAHESNLLSYFQLRVINLEYILPGLSGREIDRRIDVTVIDLLTRAGFDVVGRANNHALDYGPEGVRYNTTQWTKAGLATIGTRDSPVYEWKTGGRQIAIYALTAYIDREDPERLILRTDEADLALLKQRTASADFRIAFVHLGSMSFFPSPHERRQVVRILDAGADLVVCTGSHFIKGFITEQEKPVVYGIGNHLFSVVDRNTEPFGMHLIAGFRAGQFVQLFAIPFWNTILEENTGPLDESTFNSFKKTLLERSTDDSTRYFSDPHSLSMLKENIKKVNFSSFNQLRMRHFLYAFLIVFQNYPIIMTLCVIILLILLTYFIRQKVLACK